MMFTNTATVLLLLLGTLAVHGENMVIRGTSSATSDVSNNSEVRAYLRKRYDTSSVQTSSTRREVLNVDHLWWEELPKSYKNMAKILGYNEDLWDDDADLPIFEQDWSDLGRLQQEAVEYFGWEYLWDIEGEGKGSPGRDRFFDEPSSHHGERPWDHSYWNELPPNIQAAAAILGYDQDSWDNDDHIPIFDLNWMDLTRAQKEAVDVFGWPHDIWAGSPISASVLSSDIQSISKSTGPSVSSRIITFASFWYDIAVAAARIFGSPDHVVVALLTSDGGRSAFSYIGDIVNTILGDNT